MARVKKIKSPTQAELIEPTFAAIVDLGGSATNDEIREKIIDMLQLSDEIVDELHLGKASQQTELEYQLAWARTYMKKYGAIENCSHGVWAITPNFSNEKSIDSKVILKTVVGLKTEIKDKKEIQQVAENDVAVFDAPEEIQPWKAKLIEVLHNMDPFAFERLSQRLLRECGFSQVQVTKKTGDGGIDGTGKLKINGIFSFNVWIPNSAHTFALI